MGYKGFYDPYEYDVYNQEPENPTSPQTAFTNQTVTDDGGDYDFMSDVNSYLANKTSTPPFIPAGTTSGTAQGTQQPLVAQADSNRSGAYFTPPNAGGYNATVPATGGYSLPDDLAPGAEAPPEGTFGGYDAQGNRVSINPAMADAYNEGWRPGEGNCPNGQKWDPEKQKCYSVKWQSYEPYVNLALMGMNAINERLEAKDRRKREGQFKNMTMADAIMPAKPRNRMNMGLYDVNTGQIPLAGTYNTNYIAPGEFLPMSKQGGRVMHLSDSQIKNIIAMGGQVEFLD